MPEWKPRGGARELAEKSGLVTLTAGSATVTNKHVQADSRIFLTVNTPSGTPGTPRVSGRTPGTSFSVASSSALDGSTVAWLIVNP